MAGGGGAWKVAYADFVTAMMAFFMVMWLVGQDENKKKAVSDYFQDPWANSRINTNRVRNPSLNSPNAGQTDPKKKFAGSNPAAVPHDDPESVERKRPKLVTVRAPERSTAGTIVTFELGETTLDENAKQRLDGVLSSFTGLSHKIDIRGHVTQNSEQVHADDTMWHLSYKRCLAVMHYLKDLGISPERMRLSVAGPYEPLVLDSKNTRHNDNARVEVFLLSETVGKFHGSPKDINTANAIEDETATMAEPTNKHSERKEKHEPAKH